MLKNGTSGLYYTSNPTSNSPGWNRITENSIDNKQIIKLKEENSILFISLQESKDDNDYSLYSYDGITFDDIDANLTNRSKPVMDITWNGSTYWAVTGHYIYEINAARTSSNKIDIDSDGDFGGIFYNSSSGKTYVSSEKGNIYIYNGSEWDYLADDDIEKISGNIVTFTGVTNINGNILVGTHGYGFFEMRDGTLGDLKRAGKNDDMESLLSSDLYFSHVLSFYITPSNLVFFCTGGDGLYHNTYNGSEWSPDWVHE
jgi:hypothetical protein